MDLCVRSVVVLSMEKRQGTQETVQIVEEKANENHLLTITM